MGLSYDFESDKKYNFDNAISMSIELGKTCFTPGEFVNGKIILKPKEGTTNNILQNPLAVLSLTQEALYIYNVEEMDPYNNYKKHYVTKEAKETFHLLYLPLNLSNYNNAELINNTIITIPFSFQVPLKIYPSCFFAEKTYIKHFLCIDFPSISAKKTLIIVIKNPPYFNIYNNLYQSPATCYKEMKKSKLILFSQGSFTAVLKLPKNAFSYQEVIPFEVDMDLSKLSLNVKYIRISIRRDTKKNLQYDHYKPFKTVSNIIAKKEIYIDNQNSRNVHIMDTIEIEGDKNPLNIYRQLDNDNRKVSEKFYGIYLYPTCIGGLLSVEYFIKMELVMDSFFSSNEEFIIPIDLYEPYANDPNLNIEQNIAYPNQNIIYPNQDFSYQNSYPQKPFSSFQNTQQEYNNQIYPQTQIPQMSQIVPPSQQVNQNNINENLNDSDNLPSKSEIMNMNNTPEETEDDNPAPPSFLNINNNKNPGK